MTRSITLMYTVLIGGLGIVGLFVWGRLFGLMNVDMNIDILRLVLAAALGYAVFVNKDNRLMSLLLVLVGVMYVGMGVWGVIDPTLSDILPSGLTGFDIGFHLLTGVLALIVGLDEFTEAEVLPQ